MYEKANQQGDDDFQVESKYNFQAKSQTAGKGSKDNKRYSVMWSFMDQILYLDDDLHLVLSGDMERWSP